MSIVVPLLTTPQTLGIDVDFYDDDEKKAFQRIGLQLDLPKQYRINFSEFCAYYLYYKKRPDVAGYQSHDDLAQKWYQAAVELDGQVVYQNGSCHAASTAEGNRGTSERLGEAVGLAIVSQLHNLHNGDWTRIPESNTQKTFDFEQPQASTGTHIIQLEAKGSITEDNNRKSPSVSNHKTNIKAKKVAVRPANSGGLFYGTIGVLGEQPGSVIKCWLVDPPPYADGEPARQKVLSRLEFISDLVSYLGARSNLASALQTRLSVLRQIGDIDKLNNVALRRGNAEEFALQAFDPTTNARNSWFSGKSVVSDGPTGGHVLRAGPSILFVGIMEDLVNLVSRQSFQEIESYSFESGRVFKQVDCIVSKGRFNREFKDIVKAEATKAEGTYVRFRAQGNLNYTQAGLVFGFLDLVA